MSPEEFQSLKDALTILAFPIMGFFTWFLSYRAGKHTSQLNNAVAVKKLATDLQERADDLAEKLRESDIKKAALVRESIENYVNNALSIIETKGYNRHDKIEADVESRNALLYLELKNIMTLITGVINDLDEMKGSDERRIDKIDKRLSLLEQLNYGIRTKSENPIFSDEPETQAHLDAPAPDDSIFAETEEEKIDRKNEEEKG